MDAPRRPRRRRRRPVPPWVGFLATTLLALVIALFAGTTRSYFVPTDSMAPTLEVNDQFRADTYFAPQAGPQPGELWVLNNPHPEDGNGATLVKRVLAGPGDRVAVQGGTLRVNDQQVPEPYVAEPMAYEVKPLKLKDDQYWVLGDNRNASEDSHSWGPVLRSQFVGRVWVRYWPLNRFRWF
jgi:signal peptidase I